MDVKGLTWNFCVPFDLTGNGLSMASWAQLSLTTRKYGWIIQAKKAMTVSHCGFTYAVRTGTPPQYKIGLQSLGSTGFADGTYLGGGSPASATFTPPADATWNDTWRWIALDNSIALTAGQKVAIVIEPVGTPDGSNNSSMYTHIGNFGGTGLRFPATQVYNSGWANFTFFGPAAIKNSDASIVDGLPVESIYPTNMATNGHRNAMKFRISSSLCESFKLRGANFIAVVPGTDTIRMGLWDAAGTAIESVDIDSDVSGSVGAGLYQMVFDDAPVELAPDTDYYIGIERVTSAGRLLALVSDSAAELVAYPMGGTYFNLATWNGSAWADVTGARALVELVFDDITIPVASSGFVGSGFLRGPIG